jgi:hypothetical protein
MSRHTDVGDRLKQRAAEAESKPCESRRESNCDCEQDMSECRVMVERNRGWEKYENFQAEEDEETGRKYPEVDEQVFEESGSL